MKPRVPAGCKCAEDWNATRRIPDICGRFVGGDPNACGACRHARGCHSKRRTRHVGQAPALADEPRTQVSGRSSSAGIALSPRADMVEVEDAIGRSLEGGVRVTGGRA